MISNNEILKGVNKQKHVTWKACLLELWLALLRLGLQVDAVPKDETRLGVRGVIFPAQSEGVGREVMYEHLRRV